MPIKLEYTKAAGLVQSDATSTDKFEIKDAPLYPAVSEAVKGNTKLEITVNSFHPLDNGAVNAVDETTLDPVFFNFKDVEGKQFTVWFDPADGGNAYTGPDTTAAGNQIEVNAALAALDTKAEVATAIAAACDAHAELSSAAVDNVVTITLLRAGKVNDNVGPLTDMAGATGIVGVDGEAAATTYSWTSSVTHVEGSKFEIDTAGITRTSGTVASSFVVLPDLTSADAGAEKIVICDGGDTLVKNAAEDVTLADLDAANEYAIIVWTGTKWVKSMAAAGV
jgi:hypothetical protein